MSNIKEFVNQLEAKVDKLIDKLDLMINSFVTTAHLEAVVAKIINETQKEFQKQTTTTVLDPKTEDKKPLIGKYSYPNYNVGNPELGSSENPNSMSWPKDYFQPT